MVRLSTLGSLELRAGDGTELRALLAQPKRLALLVHLAAARPREMLRRDRLLALFWPELDERRARDALNQALHVLRQALGVGAIVSRGAEQVGISPDVVWCDAVAFQAALEEGRLEEALELYRGDLLDGFFVEGSRGFEEWLTEERGRLRAKAAQAARTLAERYESARDFTLAVDRARRALTLSWLDERALRRLMELFERVGDRAAAVQAYEDFARRLRSELDLDPSDQTRALMDRLRARTAPSGSRSRDRSAARWKGGSVADRGAPENAGHDSAPSPVAAGRAAPSPYPPFTDASDADVAKPAVPGAPSIDGFAIAREIGSGGAAIVYLAHELGQRRDVAVKVLKPEFAASIQAERFLREIRIIASLSHPHILPLLTSGRASEVLYYVTPYVGGESLRHRLEREHQLGIAEAIRIARQVALALDHAHRHGIVHRDIKPANILLADGQAQVADFGIARAIGLADDQRLTVLRAAVGTPAYMSPEQSDGVSEVDGRTDIYSLGCVLYEMVVGLPPFSGATPDQVFAKHARAPVPPVRIVRPTVPRALEELIGIALAKTAADRFASAGEFAEALEELPVHRLRMSAVWRRVRRVSAAAKRRTATLRAIALGMATVWMVGSRAPEADADGVRYGGMESSDSVLDTLRFAVIPPDSGDRLLPIGETQLVRDALARFTDISVANVYEVRDAFRALGEGTTGGNGAQRLARALHAGSYVRVSASLVGASTRFDAVRYDTRTNTPIAEASVRLSADRGALDSALAALADGLLFGEAIPRERPVGRYATNSFLARREFALGQAALERWDLHHADSHFYSAARRDPEYAQASLWLAQVRIWNGQPTTQWRFAAERADRFQYRLHQFDRLASAALAAEARGEFDRACDLWRVMTERDSTNFASWFSHGRCLRVDDVVIRSARSPSGWAFRSSHHAALDAYQTAFRLFPASNRSYRGGYFEDGRQLFIVGRAQLREGRPMPPDTGRFSAYPEWRGDSLVQIPYPRQQFAAFQAVGSDAVGLAVLHQRRRFHEATTTWRAVAPHSAEALEAVAATLDLLGNPAALDSLARARRVATPLDDRLGIAALEVWMRIKRAVPHDPQAIAEAARLADSVVAAHEPTAPRDAAILSNLSALLGRAQLSARYARASLGHEVPPALAETAPSLLAYASLGGPIDSLRALEGRVSLAIRTALTESERPGIREAWLLRPALLAVPEYASDAVRGTGAANSLRERLLGAWRNGNPNEAHGILDLLLDGRRRASLSAADLTMDILYMETAVLAALGDTVGALAWLAPSLDSLTFTAPQTIGDMLRAGPLVRAMILRAELAHATGDLESARAWARSVLLLWARPDDFLRPAIRRMKVLAR